jgi:RelA/SpoT family (p)ppGpp synthetase
MATIDEREHMSVIQSLTVPSYQDLIETCKRYMSSTDVGIVTNAFQVAARAHQGVFRRSGEPYIEHPIAVARWLADHSVAADCIAAALLHDVVEDTEIPLTTIRARFGPVVAQLVDGVTKFEAVEQPDIEDEVARLRERKSRQQAETFRKLLLVMAEDARVALIKLADRLHNMQTLASMRPDRQIAIARETLDIYVPLARRLGIGEVTYTLQDLALMYLDPQRYEWLKEHIAAEIARRSSDTEQTVNAIQQVLARHGIAASVSSHSKRIYSVHKRITPHNIDVSDLNDLITYRVLVNTRRECYAALSAIHSEWQHLDTRMRDYIGAPKLNGYQALHTTVFGFSGLFDVRICTYEMQIIAEQGFILNAAQSPTARPSRVAALNWIDQVRAWQLELSLSASDFIETVRGDLFRDQLFVFTPRGDVKDLALGATVLDMAYRIHTDLGMHCTGARVTGNDHIVRMERRDYILNSGEIVHITTDPTVVPDASWLKIAHTHHAHDAILHYLHMHKLPTSEIDGADCPLQPETLREAKLAYCCEPGPDDELVGVLRRKQLTVHQQGCHHARPHRGDSSQRLPLRWEVLQPKRYRVSLNINGQDRSGLLYDVTKVFADQGISLVRVGAHSVDSRIKACIWITIEVERPEQLERICLRLMGIEGVVNIERRNRCLYNGMGA